MQARSLSSQTSSQCVTRMVRVCRHVFGTAQIAVYLPNAGHHKGMRYACYLVVAGEFLSCPPRAFRAGNQLGPPERAPGEAPQPKWCFSFLRHDQSKGRLHVFDSVNTTANEPI